MTASQVVTFDPGFELPAFFSPIEEVTHPDLPILEQKAIVWADRIGLYATPLERAWGLNGVRPPVIPCRACVDADPERLLVFLCWSYWIWAVDDVHHHTSETGTTGHTSAPGGTTARMVDLAGRLGCALDGPGQVLPGSTRFAHALADIGNMPREKATPTKWQRFVAAHRQWTMGELWQACSTQLGTELPLETYVMQRLANTGCIPMFAGTAFANGLDISDDEMYDPAVMAAENAVNFIIGWDNDLISYAKEKFHGEADTNGVTVMARHLNCSLQDAAIEIAKLRDRVMVLFLALQEQIGRTGSDDLNKYLRSLVQYVRSQLVWCTSVPRYTVFNDHRQPPPGDFPTLKIEWSAGPSDPRLQPPAIPAIQWWWDTLKR